MKQNKYAYFYTVGVFHLQKISANFGGNFHRVKNVFHLTQVRSPPSDCDFTLQNFKNVAVNSLEVIRPFKSCKWNTHFHRKVSNGKQDYLFRSSVNSGYFPVERTKNVCPFTSQPEFPEFLGKWKTPSVYVYNGDQRPE